MTTEVQLERFEEACKAIALMQKASQAMRAFGRIAMPDSLCADEVLNSVTRSDVASVLEFFGEVIDANASAAYEFIFRVEPKMVGALMTAPVPGAMQQAE